jgi:translation initiation factor eIF-2B subunit epsilon
MVVQIVPSEVQCFGDAMRELDAKGKLRSDFILMNFDTITNAKIIPSIMKAHKDNCKRDKSTAMTVVYKKIAPGQRTGNEVLVATDKKTNRMLFHQRIHPTTKEDKFKFPLEIFLTNQEVELHHDLLDPQIAICSAAALPLFSDNFDYETRDQFIRGLVMNQEIQSDSIYVAQLPNEQYAAKVSDWNAYHSVSRDVINRWVYPLVPDMGVCCLSQQYLFLRNNIYRHKTIKLQRSCTLQSEVVLHQGCTVDEKTTLANCVFGKNCRIGKNCVVKNSYVFDNVAIEDGCVLENCFVGNNVQLKAGSSISNGAVIADNCIIAEDSKIDGFLVQSVLLENDEYSTDEFEKLGEKAYRLKEDKEEEDDYNSDDELREKVEVLLKFMKLSIANPNYESSTYSSRNDSEDEDGGPAFQQEDSHIFLSEVIESLKRGFEEKSNADFLILEINSSRYAYNMALNEVNFFVIKAAFNLPVVLSSPEPLKGLMQVYNYLGEKVLKNYIKGESAMVDCLNATVECCEESPSLKAKLMHVVKYFYDKDLLTEDAIISWYEDVEADWVKKALQPLVKWFEEAESEESDDD